MTVDVAAEKREAKTQTKMTMHTMQVVVFQPLLFF